MATSKRISRKRKHSSSKASKSTAILFPLLLVAFFIALLVRGWRKWPDILVDFGRELYVPWQISSGSVLYKDVAHLFGPLSSYFHGVLFYIFGPSFSVIILANVCVLAIFLIILYKLLTGICSRLAAFMSCTTVIFLFAFAQYATVGNYNFISPYAHETTHGMVLSSALIYKLWRFAETERRNDLIAAGVLFGLIFLTKVEVFVAILTAVLFFFVLYLRSLNTPLNTLKVSLVFLGCASVPVCAFFILFATAMPMGQAFQAIIGPWKLLFTIGLSNSFFYAKTMGIDDVKGNALQVLLQTLVFLIGLSVASGLSYKFKETDNLWIRGLCVLFAFGILVSLCFVKPDWSLRSLPVLTLITVSVLLVTYFRTWIKDRQQTSRFAPLLIWCIFALVLLGKIILAVKVYHYGFYLALPATVLLVCMLVWFIPEWLEQKLSCGYVFRKLACAAIFAFAIPHVVLSSKVYNLKVFPVGQGGDQILACHPSVDPSGYQVAKTIQWLRSNLRADQTFIVIPEGVVLNYLTRRVNPTPFTNFMPPEMEAYGEDKILDEFVKKRPDYFVIVHRNAWEYGVDFFGKDIRYGKKIMTWVDANYNTVEKFGFEPLRNDYFGIKILKRKKE